MPLKTFATVENPLLDELSERLTQEWRTPREDAKEPLIHEIRNEEYIGPTRLRVIWDAWAGMAEIERSVVIMQAYENVRGWKETMNVISAEGLTFEEAKRYGLGVD